MEMRLTFRKINNELVEENKELKEKYANEEKISRDKGRVATVEEYRKNKNNNGYNTDAAWDDKSFTAVEEIKQWGKLGEYIYKMIGEDIKLVGKESAEKLMVQEVPRHLGGAQDANEDGGQA